MKNRLFIIPFTLLSFLSFSCSTEDLEKQTEASSNKIKNERSINESTHAQFKDSIKTSSITGKGDPIIVIPPRKD